MLETSSRLHTFLYSALLTIVLICGTVHLASFVANQTEMNGAPNLVLFSAIVSGILAPPA